MKTTRSPATPKLGPGEYVPDVGFARLEDLPKPKRLPHSRNYPVRACPKCGQSAPRHKVFTRRLHDLGDLVSGRPQELELTCSQHHCATCAKYFNADSSDLAPPQGHYTHRVMAVAIRLVVEDGLPYRTASWHLWREHRVFVPFATLQNWVEAGGKKGKGALANGLPGLGTGRLFRLPRRR